MIVDTKIIYETVLPNLLSSDTWVIDVETNGLDYFGMHQICGIGIAAVGNSANNETYYFPLIRCWLIG